MSHRLHVCRICGKKFATPKGLCGHQRMHSGLQRIWGFKESRIESSFMTEIVKHEVIEAAMNLVMLSQRVYDFDSIRNLSVGDDFMDLEDKSSFKCDICDKSFVCSRALGSHQRLHRSIKGRLVCKNEYIEDDGLLSYSLEATKIVSKPSSFEVSLHCVESKLDDSGFDKSSSCGKTRFSALHSPLRSKSSSSYKCKICGKSFVCARVLGGHQTLHRSVRGQLARKKESTEDDNSLSDSSEAKKIVLQPSNLEVSRDKKIVQCVEPKLEFHELLDHSGFDKSSTCKKTRFSALTSSPKDKKIVSQTSSFEVSVDKKILHRAEPKLDDFRELFAHSGFDKSITCNKTRFSALTSSPEAKKIVSQPSSFEVSVDKKILHRSESKLDDFHELYAHSGFDKSSTCSKTKFSALTSSPEAKQIVSQPSSFEVSVEPKLADFREQFAHSGFDKFSSCSKTRFSALHSSLRSKSHSTCRFIKVCGKSFKCSQALGGHQTLHRSVKGQLARNEDGDSLSDKTDSEANKFVSQPSSFKSQEM